MQKKLTPAEKAERRKLREARRLEEYRDMEKARDEAMKELNKIYCYTSIPEMFKEKTGIDLMN